MFMMGALPAMLGARTQVRHPYGLLSADINKRGFAAAEGGEVGFFSGGGTGQGNGLLSSLMGNSAYENRKFIIDPATGNVIRNPNLPPPAATTFTNMVGSDGGGEGIAPNPDFDTPEKQRAYYAENPNQANIAGIAQSLIGMTPIGALQSYLDPEGVAARSAMLQQAPAPVDDRSVAVGTTVGSGIGTPDIQGTPLGDLAGSRTRELALGRAEPNPDGSPQTITVSDGPTSEGNGGGADGRSTTDRDWAQGGLLGLAKGGMRSGGFVIPADVVSMVGEGNTDAGYKRIKSMVPSATAIKGKDGGQSDTVKTSIEGKQRARVAHGEMYIPPETVKSLGGAKKLYAMMDRVRQQATGSKKQIKPVSLKRAMA
jgi:hypothetical protein